MLRIDRFKGKEMTEEKQVAWLVTPKEAPVMGSGGELLGEVKVSWATMRTTSSTASP